MTPVALHRRDSSLPLRRVLQFAGISVLGLIPIVLGSDVVSVAAGLYGWAKSAHPYFVPEHAVLLYVVAPIVTLSAFMLVLTPGLLLSISLNAAKSLGQWLVSALALSIFVISLGCEVVESIIGAPLRGLAFVALVAGCTGLAGGIVLFKVHRGSEVRVPAWGSYERHTLAALAMVTWLLLAALTPKIFWENFNGDGAHAFEASRLLLWQSVPFWSPAAGDVANFPGLSSALFPYPNAWFICLFGEVEAAVRLPFFLYLGALYQAILALAEVGRARRLSDTERLLVWLGPIIYAVVMAFSATYDPYAADIALPAVQDTLMMVFFFGFVLSFLQREHGWTCAYLLLTYLSSPGGLLLVAGWLFAVALVTRPIPRSQIALVMFGVLGCILVSVGVKGILTGAGLPAPGDEHGFGHLMQKLSRVQLSDWHRIAFMVVTCGLLPAVAMLWWKGQDAVARAFSVFTAAIFLFYYLQAYVSLHYFVPVMLTPVVVLWRHEAFRSGRHRAAALTAVLIGGTLALFMALPRSSYIDVTGREVGATIEDRVDGYEVMDATAFKRSELLYTLFPFKIYPSNGYVGSPLVWYHYARRDCYARRESEVNYVIRPLREGDPSGMRLAASD